jgi:hypothetical protein
VAPNTHHHFPLAIPRAIVLGQLSDHKILMDLEPQFNKYPPTSLSLYSASPAR